MASTLRETKNYIHLVYLLYTEICCFAFRLYQQRVVEDMDESNITYRLLDHFEFDAISSYPNTEDDIITMVNVPYHVSAMPHITVQY